MLCIVKIINCRCNTIICILTQVKNTYILHHSIGGKQQYTPSHNKNSMWIWLPQAVPEVHTQFIPENMYESRNVSKSSDRLISCNTSSISIG